MTIRSHKQKGKVSKAIPRLGIIALMAFAAFAVAVFAFTVKASGSPATLQSSMAGMMPGYASNQNITAECNQTMADYGLNQSVTSSMDQMMLSGTMNMMRSGCMMR